VQFAVRKVIAQAGPDGRPDPPLATPEGMCALVGRGALQGQPDRGHRPDVRQPGQRRRPGGVAHPAGSHPGPGGPDPGRPGAQPGGFGQAEALPPDGDPAGPLNRDPQDGGELIQLHSVHFGSEHQRVYVASRQRRQHVSLSVTVGHSLATLRPFRLALPENALLASKQRRRRACRRDLIRAG
jgi:hypothetical protein